MMSLFSIVDDAGTWWRVVFGITGAMGLLEIVLYYSAAGGTMTAPAKALRVVGVLDYVAILVVCADPKLPLKLNLGLTGLQFEAILNRPADRGRYPPGLPGDYGRRVVRHELASVC